MEVRQARSQARRLPADRAGQVEAQLRIRSDQLKTRRTPLGLCHVCATIVYSGDSLAIARGDLLHGGCAPGSGRK